MMRRVQKGGEMSNLRPVGLMILMYLHLSLPAALASAVLPSRNLAKAVEQTERCNPNDPDTCRSSDEGQGDHKDQKKKPQSESPPQG